VAGRRRPGGQSASKREGTVFLLYDTAHAILIASVVVGALAVLWLAFRAYQNYRISADQLYADRHRRERLLLSVPSVVLVIALFFGCIAWFIGQTRVSKTTVGALVDQGRTSGQAGLRTEAEVYKTTVETTVYYQLPGDSSTANFLNKIGQYLLHQDDAVDVQVAEYGYIDFATARSATATIDKGNHTITVDLPTPTTKTYVYSVGSVQFTEGPLSALGTAIESEFAAILHKPIVSVNINDQLQAAENSVSKNSNPAEVFGCGKNEMEQQLAGIFGSLPQYRNWSVVVDFPGMVSVPASQCQALQNQLVNSS
jgi:hypothetical protein